MAVAIYLAGAVSGCCVIWLVVASTGLGRGETGPSWRRVWLPILASTAAVATFLIIRFVAIEAPVSVYVVIRGWIGFLLVFAPVFTIAAALMMAAVHLARRLRNQAKHQPSAR